ncbi:YicC/YloC family endoribonuclease [Moritella sp. Urea-trap-13]|uniref:YicC/YloC family endoribonuclease n=1 Tax=Moritella sp. Urea-trap-13 TaxID=2058327 RepID=UPI000C32AFAC|nr:YicC/YloC family endoribonuclease [Moritella sp. Urea-trap-13]PKH07553.1 YicC family protein [Moritella sp. Urea-trap-13]
MIHSMTAYARKEFKGDWGTAVWEIRSVNQRYLETYIRLPEQFRGLEAVLRERFRKQLQRGKVECNLRFEANSANSGELQLNEALAEKLIESANWVSKKAGKAKLNPVDILRWPGVMEAAEKDMGELSTDLLSFFDETLIEFLDSRASEGEKLQAMLEQRLTGISEQADFVEGKMPEIIEWQRARIQKKFSDAKIELDETRVEQELILMAQKLDVAEEIDRLNAHVTETRSILAKGGACGRRLDFMMQEFNRESNTLGSKSISTDITKSAVELKVLIEQMREQLQNIE